MHPPLKLTSIWFFRENVDFILFTRIFSIAVGYLRKKKSNLFIYEVNSKTVYFTLLRLLKKKKERTRGGIQMRSLEEIFETPILSQNGHWLANLWWQECLLVGLLYNEIVNALILSAPRKSNFGCLDFWLW